MINYLLSFLARNGITASISRVISEPARKISGAGIYAVVIASALVESMGMLRAELIALPIMGPTIMGIRTEKTILTP